MLKWLWLTFRITFTISPLLFFFSNCSPPLTSCCDVWLWNWYRIEKGFYSRDFFFLFKYKFYSVILFYGFFFFTFEVFCEMGDEMEGIASTVALYLFWHFLFLSRYLLFSRKAVFCWDLNVFPVTPFFIVFKWRSELFDSFYSFFCL